jgi:hypothetical protein
VTESRGPGNGLIVVDATEALDGDDLDGYLVVKPAEQVRSSRSVLREGPRRRVRVRACLAVSLSVPPTQDRDR